MNSATLMSKGTTAEPALYMAMELSNKRWKLVFGDDNKQRRVTIDSFITCTSRSSAR